MYTKTERNNKDIQNYWLNTLEAFFYEVLDVEKKEACKSSKAIINSLNEPVLIKLVHFFDMVKQCTNEKYSTCSNCSHSCGNCSKAQTKE